MNVNLGAPYEAIIKKFIDAGFASNKTEVLRQALSSYERDVELEEVVLVNKGIAAEMEKIRSGKEKTVSLDYIKKKFKL